MVVDLFSIGNTQFDLATAGQISSLSGGQTFFYPFNLQDIKDFSKRLEKFHYDLSRILTRPNYYDVKFMYRGSIGFEVQEILGSFNRKLGEGFQIAGCDPDFTYAYNMKITESLKADTVYHFQIVCLYLDNFNQRFLRIFNYSLQTTSDISALYYSVDVDSMTRLLIMKELTTICGSSQDKILARENILKKLVECLYYYRTKCSKSTPMQQLILPASVKYLPLLMTSFIKSPVIRKNKSGLSSNYIVSYINRLLREPTHLTIKSLYPRLYRVDDILEGQGKLGLEDLGLVISII